LYWNENIYTQTNTFNDKMYVKNMDQLNWKVLENSMWNLSMTCQLSVDHSTKTYISTSPFFLPWSRN